MGESAKDAQIRNCPHSKTEKSGNGYWVWTFCKLCGVNLERMSISTGQSRKTELPLKWRKDTGIKIWNLPTPLFGLPACLDGEEDPT